MKKDCNAGFTLVELMVTIAVAAVLLVVAVPSFQSMLVNNRISAQTNDLVADLAIARSEAAKRGGRVTVCASDDGATCGGSWANGRIVFTDATTMGIIDGTDVVLKVSSAVKAGDSLNSSFAAGYIQYFARGVSDSSGTFTLCHSGYTGRVVTVSVTGRYETAQTTSVCS